MEIKNLLNTISEKLDISDEEKQNKINLINDKIKKIEEFGYQLSDKQSMSLSSKANYTGSFGYFNPSELKKYNGIEHNVLTFKNKDNDVKYCIFDNELQLKNKALSKLRYYDEETKNSDEYYAYMDVKEYLIPELNKEGIDITVEEAFITFKETLVSALRCGVDYSEVANSIKNDLRNAIFNLDKIENEQETINKDIVNDLRNSMFVDSNKDKINYNIIHELASCGMNRQKYAMDILKVPCDMPHNSEHAKFMANTTLKLIKDISIDMYKKGEITPTINIAEKLGIKDVILKDIFEEKSEEKLLNFLQITKRYQKEGSYQIVTDKLPESLTNKIIKEFKNNAEKMDFTKINSRLKALLTEMRKVHSELSSNTPAIDAIMQYIKSDITIDDFINMYLQPDFFEKINEKKSLKEILNEYNEKEKIQLDYIIENDNSEIELPQINEIINSIDNTQLARLLSSFNVSLESREEIKENSEIYQYISVFKKEILHKCFNLKKEELNAQNIGKNKEYCKEHKLAITMMLINDMLGKDTEFNQVDKEIQQFETALEKTYGISKIKDNDVEKLCDLLSKGNTLECSLSMINDGTINQIIEDYKDNNESQNLDDIIKDSNHDER